MNRRQKKKYEKKGFEKSWYKSRLYHIETSIYEKLLISHFDGWEVTPFNHEVEVIDSKRGNLKHPRRILVKHRLYQLPPPRPLTPRHCSLHGGRLIMLR